MGEGKVVPVRHRMSPLRHPLEALLLCVLKYIQQSFFKEILSPSLPAQLEGGDAGQLGFIPPPHSWHVPHGWPSNSYFNIAHLELISLFLDFGTSIKTEAE